MHGTANPLMPVRFRPWPRVLTLYFSIGLLHSSDSDICHVHGQLMEDQYSLPHGLVKAVLLTESGRSYQGALRAWPWSVQAQGRTRFLASKTQAIAFVKSLQKRGIRNIDVGCMQINLHYHPHFAKNITQAFCPKANVVYGVKLLRHLYEKTGSWVWAVKSYHAHPQSYAARNYYEKILRHWQNQNESWVYRSSASKFLPTMAYDYVDRATPRP